jgi:hypothetical protein
LLLSLTLLYLVMMSYAGFDPRIDRSSQKERFQKRTRIAGPSPGSDGRGFYAALAGGNASTEQIATPRS